MEDGGTPFTRWVKTNESTVNTLSIIMLIFAAWTGVEVLSNVAGGEIPPVTGTETNSDPDDNQRFNNGYIIGLGAIALSLGVTLQLMIPREFYGDSDTETTEEAVEETPVTFDKDLVKLTKWLAARGTTTAQFFKWADVDESGTIDKNEFADALRTAEIANLPPWEVDELVKILDINSDGVINLPELDIMIITIRNNLGIEFIPYEEPEEVEEEVVEQVAEEVTEEVAEEVVEETAEEEVVEDSKEEIADETEETLEESSEEEEATEEAEEVADDSDDAEEATEETQEAEEESDDAEETTEEGSEDAEEESEEDSEETEEVTEETEEEAEETSEDAEEEESEDTEEEVEEESEAVLAAKALLDSTINAGEDSSESVETEEIQEEVEEPVEEDETPKKKRKF